MIAIPGFRFDPETNRFYREGRAPAGSAHASLDSLRNRTVRAEAATGQGEPSRVPPAQVSLPLRMRDLESSVAQGARNIRSLRRHFMPKLLSASSQRVLHLADTLTDESALPSGNIADFDIAHTCDGYSAIAGVQRQLVSMGISGPCGVNTRLLGRQKTMASSVCSASLVPHPTHHVTLVGLAGDGGTAGSAICTGVGFNIRNAGGERCHFTGTMNVRNDSLWCARGLLSLASSKVQAIVGVSRKALFYSDIERPKQQVFFTGSDVLNCALTTNIAWLGCRNGEIRVFDVRASPKSQNKESGMRHMSAVTRVLPLTRFSPDTFGGDSDVVRVATCAMNGQIYLWDRRRIKEPVVRYRNHVSESLIRAGVAVDPSRTMLAAAGQDGVVRTWDIDSGEPLASTVPIQRGDTSFPRTSTSLVWVPDAPGRLERMQCSGLWTADGQSLICYRI